MLNQVPHPSTIICPITTNIKKEAEILRVRLKKEAANLYEDCDVMVDQIRSIDNNRLTTKIGALAKDTIKLIKENINIVMDLD